MAQEDMWMLKINQEQIMSYTVEDKQFWINAVNVGMRACANALDESDRVFNRWSEVVLSCAR